MLKPPRVFAHDGRHLGVLEEVEGFEALQIDTTESQDGTVALFVGRDSGYLHHTRLWPGGRPVYYRVDATDLGQDESGRTINAGTAIARAVAPQGQINQGTWQIQAEGPSRWLDREFLMPSAQPMRLRGSRLAERTMGGRHWMLRGTRTCWSTRRWQRTNSTAPNSSIEFSPDAG